MGGQFGVDDLQCPRAEFMLFEQMTESREADLIWNELGAADGSEVAVEAGLEQGFFGPRTGHAKPLLQAVNSQPSMQVEIDGDLAWPPVRAAI